MKKLIIVAFILLMNISIILSVKPTEAKGYQYFQSMDFETDKVKLVDEWDKVDETKYLIQAGFRKKMFGWNTYYVWRKEPFSYVSDTLYYVKNDGFSDLTHTFKYEESSESTIQRTATGSLGIEGNLTKDKKYKFGLEGELEYEYKESIKTKVTETDQVKVTVSPNSTLNIKVQGEGYFYQGLARKYFFWIISKKGSFEYVLITAEYYSIEVVKNHE